ncbi:MAG: LysR family transcriptional regulator [Butyrivibrio sp.]|uniref:LysR family transcriptional regulator n=1 Tax=Butyrivibrio sp. TaxID=28121 RepID=UPI0025E7171A|nr:LysR family transcriptional regulator [Butyrivibrio sp.]MCR5772611.1 LysR family transcriptional regulator [Butyrivibrio sp.]
MDIRIMQYFLAVIREGTISGAAEALHVAQPSLSRQMRELEEELGVTLFERGNRRITLTEEGLVLRKRAEEMISLMQQTEDELSQVKNNTTGTIRIGAGESWAFQYIARVATELTHEYPGIKFSVKSGDTIDLMDELGKGLLDFALIFSDHDPSIYQSATLPGADIYGVLMRKDSPLAKKKSLTMQDLLNEPVIISRGAQKHFSSDEVLSKLNITATYNLIYNASVMVKEGMGYAICFNRLINTSGDSELTFVPLKPEMKIYGKLIWKKYQVLSPAIKKFIEKINVIL